MGFSALAYLHVQKLLLPGVQTSHIQKENSLKIHKNQLAKNAILPKISFFRWRLSQKLIFWLFFNTVLVWTPSKTHLVQKDSISNGVVRDT